MSKKCIRLIYFILFHCFALIHNEMRWEMFRWINQRICIIPTCETKLVIKSINMEKENAKTTARNHKWKAPFQSISFRIVWLVWYYMYQHNACTIIGSHRYYCSFIACYARFVRSFVSCASHIDILFFYIIIDCVSLTLYLSVGFWII